MHKLLERQLKKIFGSLERTPEAVENFLNLVDDTYLQADADRELLERSLDLTSQELLEANAELRRDREELEHRVQDRTSDLLRANTSLQREIAERRGAQLALRQSEMRYQALAENSPSGIMQADATGACLYLNKKWCEMAGVSSDDAEGDRWLETVHPRDRDRLEASWSEAVKRKVERFSTEFRFLNPDGRTFWVVGQAVALRDDQEKLTGYVMTATDLTERKKSEEAVLELEHQLHQAKKMEAVGELAGGVAHDFNNLLTAIAGYSDLVGMSLPPEDPAVPQVKEIRRAAQRGGALTRQLLALSRRQVLKPKVLSLNSVLGEMDSLLSRILGENIELVTNLDPELGAVRADPGQIEQVILNLVLNARDAMPEGGRLVLTTDSLEVQGDASGVAPGLVPGRYVRLSVEDTCGGIDREIQDRMFEPFFTTKERGTGTGLGLATVYGIVNQSGGSIEVKSMDGQGCCFEICLPLVDARPEPATEVVTPVGIRKGTETILLAEDEPAVRSLLEQFLRRSGYEVLSAADGEEALRVAEEYGDGIDLLLTDVVMPRLGGIDLARKLKSARPGLKVVVMSGYTGKRSRQDTEAQGLPGAPFLQKPFSTESLGRTLREVLDTRPAPPEPPEWETGSRLIQ